MELKQLQYFKAVADEGTISAAARRLNISQPPLSSQMHLLEEELGCVLFERGPRKIQLTEAGRLFYERAGTILELAQATGQEMQDFREGEAGTLRLGVVSSVERMLLEKWLIPFHREFPQIRYEIYEGNTYQLLEQLRSDLVELAIVRTPFDSGGLETVHLIREPMMAAGMEQYFQNLNLGRGGIIPLCALADLPLIVYRRWEDILTREFARAGLHPRYFCKNDDARTTLEWAAAGLGVAIFPESAVLGQAHTGMCLARIQEKGLESEICVEYSPHRYLSAGARAFLKNIQK